MVLVAVGCTGQEADRTADGQVLAGPAGSTAEAGEPTDGSDGGAGGEGSEGTGTSLDLADAEFEDLVIAAMERFGREDIDGRALAAAACNRRLSVEQVRAITDDPTLELNARPLFEGVGCAYPPAGGVGFDISWEYQPGRTPEDVAQDLAVFLPRSVVGPAPQFGEGALGTSTTFSYFLLVPEGESVITAKASDPEWAVELMETLQASAN
jgi:hypothetical protein